MLTQCPFAGRRARPGRASASSRAGLPSRSSGFRASAHRQPRPCDGRDTVTVWLRVCRPLPPGGEIEKGPKECGVGWRGRPRQARESLVRLGRGSPALRCPGRGGAGGNSPPCLRVGEQVWGCRGELTWAEVRSGSPVTVPGPACGAGLGWRRVLSCGESLFPEMFCHPGLCFQAVILSPLEAESWLGLAWWSLHSGPTWPGRWCRFSCEAWVRACREGRSLSHCQEPRDPGHHTCPLGHRCPGGFGGCSPRQLCPDWALIPTPRA